jgi:hypothetical protein
VSSELNVLVYQSVVVVSIQVGVMFRLNMMNDGDERVRVGTSL